MKTRIEEILKDLYLLDPGLKGKKQDLRKMVKELSSIKPDVKVNKKFKDKLQKDLLHQFTEKADERKTVFQTVLQWIMGKKLKLAFGCVAVSIIAGIFIFQPYHPEKQDLILSSGKEILEIDLEKTKRFKIQGVNFDLKNCIFVDKNGNTAHGKIKIKFKNFNEPDSVISSKYDLVYKKNKRKLPFVSGGMFDLNIYSKKNKLNIKKNSYIRINYPVLKVLAKEDIKEMKIYSVNEKTGSWEYESRPVIAKLDNKEYFKFKVTHLSYWNIDYPLNTHACIKGEVKFEDHRDVPDNSVRIIAVGENYIGRTSAFAVKGRYETDVRRSSKIKVIAVTGDGQAGILEDISIGDKQGRAGQSESSQNYKYKMEDIVLSKKKFKELKKKYDLNNLHFLRSVRRIVRQKRLIEDVAFGEDIKNYPRKDKIIFEATVVKRRTYFKAWVDGVEKEGIIYNPGKAIRLEADNVIQLQAGSAGSLNVKINGKSHNLGKVGTIVNKIIKWERSPQDKSRYNLIIKDWIK